MRFVRTVSIAAGALAAVTLLPAGAVGVAAAPPPPAARADDNPNFVSNCQYSHRASDDPIVFPGQPGASHSHDFIANRSTNAASTYASLRAASSLCRRGGDTAAYWVPTLYDNGVAVAPRVTNAYYLPNGKELTSIKPFPAGLKVVAGNAKATSAQSLQVARWTCTGDTTVAASSLPPTCPARSNLLLIVRFPDCWNGRDLDSADHKSHLAYAARRQCPSTHPVPLPLLALHVNYPVAGGSGITLASGSPYTAHADFFNAWNQRVLTDLVCRCLNAGVHCGRENPPALPA